MAVNNDKAAARYAALQDEVAAELTTLMDLVAAHEPNAKDEINYGHVGDLAHVKSLINEAVRFLRNED